MDTSHFNIWLYFGCIMLIVVVLKMIFSKRGPTGLDDWDELRAWGKRVEKENTLKAS